MAKGKLEFDLDDIDDFREHLMALHGRDFAFCLWNIKNNLLRQAYKNEWDSEKLSDEIKIMIQDLGVDIDFLVV